MPGFEIGPLELLILQGTPFCNIDCKYCYLPDRLNKDKMSMEIIQRSMDNLVADKLIAQEFTVLWHAGEPLVLPIDYYEEAIALIRKSVPRGVKVTSSFQTNGLLINESSCRFFKKNNAEVGLSIDGPEFIHDRNRLTRTGKGTFSKVMKAVELFHDHHLSINIIAVVTAFSCDYPEAMYAFLKSIGAESVSFNFEEVAGAHSTSSFTNLTSSKEKVKKFLNTIYRLNLSDGEPLFIREYDWATSTLLESDLNPRQLFYSQMNGPFKVITINTNGDFSTFSPELLGQKSSRYGDFVLGNVLKDSFFDSSSTRKFKLIFGDLKKGLMKCKNNCDYFGLCPGGMPSSKFSEHATLDCDETLYCQLGLQAPIDTLLEMVKEEEAGSLG